MKSFKEFTAEAEALEEQARLDAEAAAKLEEGDKPDFGKKDDEDEDKGEKSDKSDKSDEEDEEDED